MIKKNQNIINIFNMIIDILLVVLSYILSSFFWLTIVVKTENVAAWNGRTLTVAFIYSFSFWLLLAVTHFYNTDRRYKLKQKIARIILSSTVTIISAACILYFFRLQEFSRGVFICFYLSSTAAVSLKYAVMRYISNVIRLKGINQKNLIVIGTGQLAEQFAADIKNAKQLGYRIIGFVGSSSGKNVQPIIGDFDSLDSALQSTDIDEAIIALDIDEAEHISDAMITCDRNGIRCSMIPFYNDLITTASDFSSIGRSNMISFRRNRLDNVGWAFVKRVFDILASSFGIIFLSPLMALIALGVKLSSPGKILFRQQRVGKSRKMFTMLKFRSMVESNCENTAWTTDNDPRRTKFGMFIRKYSLDELPQLFNCLTGKMSLVGPRPELPFYVEKFREIIPFYMLKHQVRPGMTGWAQINGYRGDSSIEKRIEYDLWYIENWSVWLDIKILFLTVFGGHFINNESTGSKRKEGVAAR